MRPTPGVDSPRVVVVIAASRGGVHAISAVLAALPADFPGAFLIVQHLSARAGGLLPAILATRTRLRVVEAIHGAALRPGWAHTAPPGRHLIVAPNGSIALSLAPPVRYSRPAADLLFETTAAYYGDRVIGVILTGGDVDGSDGARAIRAAGGRVITQDPATALAPGMPLSAVATGVVDFVLPLPRIADTLMRLAERGTAP